MSLTRKAELHLLSEEEQDLVAQSRHPALSMLPDSKVEKIRDLIRNHLNLSQAQSLQERKDRRSGKAASGKSTGIRIKTCALAAAAKRINKEIARRRTDAAKDAG